MSRKLPWIGRLLTLIIGGVTFQSTAIFIFDGRPIISQLQSIDLTRAAMMVFIDLMFGAIYAAAWEIWDLSKTRRGKYARLFFGAISFYVAILATVVLYFYIYIFIYNCWIILVPAGIVIATIRRKMIP